MPVSAFTGITRPFDAGFFSGPATSAVSIAVGTTYDVALGGRGYILDLLVEGGSNGYTMKSMPLLQRYYLTQTQGSLGEQSLNPEDYWRRSVDSWQNGAGQLFNDHDTSTRDQFRTSKGIDPWTPGRLTLLHDTTQIAASSNTNLALAVAGDFLYMLDGTAWNSSPDGTSFAALAGTALTGATTLSSDGFTVWTVDSTDTYYTERGTGTYQTWFAAPRPGTLARSVKGRLFVCDDNIVYTSTGAAGAATSTAFFTHPNPDWTWVDVAEGPTAIYFAGFSGDKSIIYQTQIASDGTDLVIPSASAILPSGEIVRSIQGYLGVMLIGTDKGVRVAAIDSQGNLTVGDLIKTDSSVECFETQEQFAWFGWPNYEGTSGLGRVNLGVFNSSAPAYATDLMAGDTGPVSSIETYATLIYFTVQGSGLWAEVSNQFVASGSIKSGGLNYSLPDVKIAVKFDISYFAGAGTITASLSADNQPFVQMGAVTTIATKGGNSVIPSGLVEGRTHEVQLVLARDADPTQAPIIDRWTLLSNPAPERRVQFIVALLLHERIELRNKQTTTINPLFERNQINAWMQSNEVITFQDAEASYAVTVDDFEWRSNNNVNAHNRIWDGTDIVTLKVIA